MSRAVIFANGDLPDLDKARALLAPDDVILCADGGLHHARALGMKPQVVIGDMDSLTKAELSDLTRSEVEIHLFQANKNETDLELALKQAVEAGYREILIMAGLGRRLDQTIANIALLSGYHPADVNIRMDDGVEEVFFCKDEVAIQGRSGDLVSLIPWGGIAGGVRTEGLKWPLADETLQAERSRGISNEMLADHAKINIAFGALLVIHRRIFRPTPEPSTNPPAGAGGGVEEKKK